jgi:superoxide oxidase
LSFVALGRKITESFAWENSGLACFVLPFFVIAAAGLSGYRRVCILIEELIMAGKYTQSEYYDPLSRFLHWLMAVSIIYNLLTGYLMLFFLDDPQQFSVLSEINISLAYVGFNLFILRWIWSFFRREVTALSGVSVLQQHLAKLVHSLLYFNLFVVYVSGLLMMQHPFEVFGVVTINNLINTQEVNHFFFGLHRFACVSLTLLILLHVLAALKHQWLAKNNVLSRMLGPLGGKPQLRMDSNRLV